MTRGRVISATFLCLLCGGVELFRANAKMMKQKQSALKASFEDEEIVVPATVALDNLQVSSESSLDVAKQECTDIPLSICVEGKPMLPQAQLKHLVGHYTFDDMVGHDSSGNGNGMIPHPEVGPSRGGVGASAYFNGTNYGFINHIGAFESTELTVAFWVFLLQERSTQYRYLIHKGKTLSSGGTPTLSIMSNNRLHLQVTTQAGTTESMDSKAAIYAGRWTHIAVVISVKSVQLYVNGIVDAEFIASSRVQFNQEPIHVARGPSSSGVACYMDDLRILKSAVSDAEVQAWSFGALGMVPPNFVRLGCTSCSKTMATSNCVTISGGGPKYELCSVKNLYEGAISVARAQGWARMRDRKFWNSTYNDDGAGEQDSRIGLCCAV